MQVFCNVRVVSDWSLQEQYGNLLTQDKSLVQNVSDRIHKSLDGLALLSIPPQLVQSLLRHKNEWQIALSPDGSILAVLQDTKLELRAKESSFEEVYAYAPYTNEQASKWRQLAWSHDSNVLAVSRSNGQVDILDTKAQLLATLPSVKSLTRKSTPPELFVEPLAALLFVSGQDNSVRASWPSASGKNANLYELVMVTFEGELASFMINVNHAYQGANPLLEGGARPASRRTKATFLLFHRFAFGPWHAFVTCAALSTDGTFLCVAGRTTADANERKGDVQSEAMVTFKLLPEAPYYEVAYDGSAKQITQARPTRTVPWWKRMFYLADSFRTSTRWMNSVPRIVSVSSDGSKVVAVDIGGNVLYWRILEDASLALAKVWSRDELAYEARPSALKGVSKEAYDYANDAAHVISVRWGTNSSIVLVFSTGCVVLGHVDELHNRLAASECFRNIAGTSAMVDDVFYALECQESDMKARLVGDKVVFSRVRKETDIAEKDLFDLFWTVLSWLNWILYYIVSLFVGQYKVDAWNNDGWTSFPMRKYRLMQWKQTSPLDLLQNKIDLLEFDDAIKFAQEHQLDMDIVYKAMWIDAQVNAATIANLSRIQDIVWVLTSCVERIPDSPHEMRLLLHYGLERTDIHDELQTELTELQVLKCKFRLVLLKYLERLDTFEQVMESIYTEYDVQDKMRNFAQDFLAFRDVNVVLFAIELAQQGRLALLKILVERYAKDLLPFRYAILDNIPETLDPSLYAHFLPGYSVDGVEETTWTAFDIQENEPDWVEANYKHTLRWVDDVHSPDLDAMEVARIAFPADVRMAEQWYRQRACNIDYISGRIDYAIGLLEQGVAHHVVAVQSLIDETTWFSKISHALWNVPASGISGMSFNVFRELSDSSVVELLFSSTDVQLFGRNFAAFVIPFIRRCIDANPSADMRQAIVVILFENVLKLSKLHLDCAFVAIESLKEHQPSLQIITDRDLIALGLSCLYGYAEPCSEETFAPYVQALATIGAMQLQTTHEHAIRNLQDANTVFGELNGRSDAYIADMHAHLNVHLMASTILNTHHIHLPLKWYLSSADKASVQQGVFEQIVKNAVHKTRTISGKRILHVLDELDASLAMLFHVCQVFPRLDAIESQEFLLAQLLRHGLFSWVQSAIQQPKEFITLDKARREGIVVQVATEFYDGADSGTKDSGSIKLALDCLALLPHATATKSLMNLIEAMAILSSYKLEMRKMPLLPVHVRQSKDRFSFIQLLMAKHGELYRQPKFLFKLAEHLELTDDQCAQANLWERIGHEAAKHDDVTKSIAAYKQLFQMESKDKRVLRVHRQACETIATTASIPTDVKYELLSDYLMVCDASELFSALSDWKASCTMDTKIVEQVDFYGAIGQDVVQDLQTVKQHPVVFEKCEDVDKVLLERCEQSSDPRFILWNLMELSKASTF